MPRSLDVLMCKQYESFPARCLTERTTSVVHTLRFTRTLIFAFSCSLASCEQTIEGILENGGDKTHLVMGRATGCAKSRRLEEERNAVYCPVYTRRQAPARGSRIRMNGGRSCLRMILLMRRAIDRIAPGIEREARILFSFSFVRILAYGSEGNFPCASMLADS